MGTFSPVAGLEAPVSLPPASGAVSAQTTNMGGSDSVTLVATPTALPVNDPSLRASGPSSDLGTYTSIPTTSSADAAGYVSKYLTQTFPSCSGTATPVGLGSGAAARACSSAQGELLSWTAGTWIVQVLSVGGDSPDITTANLVATWLSGHPLPSTPGGGLLVSAPATPADGSSVSSALVWSSGADVYETRSAQGATAAAALGESMRPWSG